MSDTAPRNPTSAAQMMADALLRTVAGATVLLRVTGMNAGGSASEVGLVATTFADVPIAPALLRKLRPTWQGDGQAGWELLVSATGVEAQVHALDLPSAWSLFSMAAMVTTAGQDYLIESVSSNEAFGQIYLYRLLLREARPQAV